MPPGPISNPGRVALAAALHPARTNFYYFVLKDAETGQHYFSDSLKQHNWAKYYYLEAGRRRGVVRERHMRIPDRILAQITERLDVAEVVSQYTHLEKRGGRYWGLCPFHTEKTPSFTVTPDKAVFYCFGCQKGGSLFTFIMEAEKLSFLEAVRLLAGKAGVELELEEDEDAGRRKAYLELYRRVAGSLHYILLNHPEAGPARAYLEGRGFRRETLERFQVGYAPPGRDWLFGFLREKSFSEEFLRSCGPVFPVAGWGPGGPVQGQGRVPDR